MMTPAESNKSIHPNSLETLLSEYFICLAKFQYEKAKNLVEKHKESSLKLWQQLQTVLLNYLNAEKYYNNLLFFNQKSINKLGEKYFEPTYLSLESMLKEFSTPSAAASIGEYQSIIELSNQLLQLIEFRFQMMAFYFYIKETNQERTHFELAINQLNETEEKLNRTTNHELLMPLVDIYRLEIDLARNLIDCHLCVDHKLDCIRAMVCIKEIYDLFSSKLPLLNMKQSLKETKSFSIFSRSSSNQKSIPTLYQWFKLYYDLLVNKFSLIMHDSFQMIDDVDHILNEKIEVYNKLMNFIKKFNPYLTGILMDSNGAKPTNFRGIGYEPSLSLNSHQLQGIESFSLLFSHPEYVNDLEKHLRILIVQMSGDLDSKVKFLYDPNLKSTYYLSRIGENFMFFMLFETNKQENKAKTLSFVQEISDELNLSNVFNLFNPNLK